MKLKKCDEYETKTYEIGGGYFVDIVKYLPDGSHSAYIWNDRYEIKSFMMRDRPANCGECGNTFLDGIRGSKDDDDFIKYVQWCIENEGEIANYTEEAYDWEKRYEE